MGSEGGMKASEKNWVLGFVGVAGVPVLTYAIFGLLFGIWIYNVCPL